jgi:hypothetical protein
LRLQLAAGEELCLVPEVLGQVTLFGPH